MISGAAVGRWVVKNWRVVAALAVCALVWWRIDAYGDRREAKGAAGVQALWDASKARGAILLAEAEREARRVEREQQARYDAVAGELARERDDAIQERDAVLADAAAGRLRLRDKFRCPAAGVPGAADPAAGGDEAEGGVLSFADQEFLVRLGHEADDAVRALTACQSLLAQPE